LLQRSTEPMSAVQMAKSVRDTGNKLSHHLKVLESFEVVTLVNVKKVRGATENLYESRVVGHATVELILADTEKEDGHLRR
jgi:predicted ArsR family transcriptional regulator